MYIKLGFRIGYFSVSIKISFHFCKFYHRKRFFCKSIVFSKIIIPYAKTKLIRTYQSGKKKSQRITDKIFQIQPTFAEQNDHGQTQYKG